MRAAVWTAMVGVAALAVAGAAHASVTYTLVDEVYTLWPLQLSFTVSDAAVARGSLFVEHEAMWFPFNRVDGDAQDLIVFHQAGATADPAHLRDWPDDVSYRISITFDAQGDVATSLFDIRLNAEGEDGLWSGSSTAFGGTYMSDRLSGYVSGYDWLPISGRLERSVSEPVLAASTVPEPDSISLLGLGLLGVWRLGVSPRRPSKVVGRTDEALHFGD